MPAQSSHNVSSTMRKVRSHGTKAELVLRKALWAAGFRYRLNCSYMPGKPDIVLASKRTAVFVDGDFWHGHQWRRRGLAALEDQFQGSADPAYWLGKIRRNMQRDCKVTQELLITGWRVLRVWESDVLSRLQECTNMAIELATHDTVPDSYSVLPRKTFAEFFAGIGLVRMALELEGWSLAYANDIDEMKHAMYSGNFRDADNHYEVADIHHIPSSSIPTVTLATASFPCNDLSLAGARQGLKGEQSSAFWGFVRLLEEMGIRKPPLVLLENVPGFLTSHGGDDFRDALIALNDQGYATDAFFVNAAQFVPQSRLRLFVVGVADPKKRTGPVRELPRTWESELRPSSLRGFILAHPEINWHLRDLPQLSHEPLSLRDVLEDLGDMAPEWWSAERTDYLLNQMSERHRAQAEAMMQRDHWSYGTVFRRVRKGRSMAELRTDGVAGCLRTPRGGSGRQILFRAGLGRCNARLITPRECARLMGADDYHIDVPANQALFGFGDAVCVPVLQWIARYYLNPVVNEMIRGVGLVPQR